MDAKVETQLQQTLTSFNDVDELVDVVLRFELPPAAEAHNALPLTEKRQQRAQQMSKAIERALARAGAASGDKPAQVSLFPMVGSAYVQAHKPYLRALVEQDEVTGAMLNTPRG